MTPFSKLFSTVWLLSFFFSINAQVEFTALGQSFLVDFDSSVPGICDGPIQGTGFTAEPAAGSGMIDSDAIAFDGLVNPVSMPFGGTATTGDAAKGLVTSGGADDGGGFYAFSPGDGRAFGWQPSTTHFNPGNITFKMTNMTGEMVNEFSLGMDVYLRNSTDRATTYAFSFSTDGVNYTTLPGFDTPADKQFIVFWVGPGFIPELSINQDICLPEPMADGQTVFARLEISDAGVGPGTLGDEVAFDNINLSIGDRVFCAATPATEVGYSRSMDNTSVTINWTNPVGCFDAIVVVGREGEPVSIDVDDPDMDGFALSQIDDNLNVNSDWSARSADNEVYEISQNLRGTALEDYFVYKGIGTSVTISNLDAMQDYYFRLMAVSAGCDWAKGDNLDALLPLSVEWGEFSAKLVEKQVLLEWSALNSSKEDYFTIEHSSDGQHFYSKGKVEVKIANTLSHYHFWDTQPVSGKNYYRLQLIAQDGRLNYSELAVVEAAKNDTAIRIFPKVEDNLLRLYHLTELEKGQSFEIFDNKGYLIMQGRISEEVSLPELESGVYFFKIYGRNTIPFTWIK